MFLLVPVDIHKQSVAEGVAVVFVAGMVVVVVAVRIC